MGEFAGKDDLEALLKLTQLTGSLVGVSLMWWTGSDTKYAIPFGPFLALGAITYIFCGDQIIGWYLGFGAG